MAREVAYPFEFEHELEDEQHHGQALPKELHQRNGLQLTQTPSDRFGGAILDGSK